MLGGTIRVSSKKGSGSTFTFTLPYIKQQAKEARTITKPEKGQPSLFSNLSMLIAEDEEIGINLFKAIFKNTFRKITYTKTGKETIEHEPIPVSDIRMGVTAPANDHHWVGYAAIKYN